MQPGSFTITPSGPFSLAEAATFGFGQRAGGSWDGVMRLAFCLDGYADQVGVEDRQDEAAAWCVLSARRPARQMMQARDRLSRAHGQVFDLAGEPVAALPTPGQLLAIDSFPGIPADRMPRLHGVARAALDGQLHAARLLDQGPERAMAGLQALDGIGPFYSSLIVVRGTGFTDVLPVNEPRALDLAGRLYQLGAPPSEAEFRKLAQPWKPLRTWAVVLIRAAAARLLGEAGAGQAEAPAGVR